MPTASSPLALLTPSPAATGGGRRESAPQGESGGFADLMRSQEAAPKSPDRPRPESGSGEASSDRDGKALPPERAEAAAPAADGERSGSEPGGDEAAGQRPEPSAEDARPAAATQAKPDAAAASGLQNAANHAASPVVDSLNAMLQHAAAPTAPTAPTAPLTATGDGAVEGLVAAELMVEGEGAESGESGEVLDATPLVGGLTAGDAAPVAVPVVTAAAQAPAAQASVVAVAASGTAASVAADMVPGAMRAGGDARSTPGQLVQQAVAEARAAMQNESRGGAVTAPTGTSAQGLSERGMVPELLLAAGRDGQASVAESVATSLAAARGAERPLPRLDGGAAPTASVADAAMARTPATPAAAATLSAEPPPLPMQAKNFDQLLGERMMMLVNQRVQSAEIRLSPAHLGSIEVRLSMNGDQANVQFLAASAVTRESLEASMPRLREMFAEAGLQLRDSGVQDQRASARDGHPGGQGRGASVADGDAADLQPAPVEVAIRRVGLLDTYA